MWHIAQYAAVRGRTLLVLTGAELLGVVGRHQLELRRMTREAVLGGDKPRASVCEPVTAIARHHVGSAHVLDPVSELRVADGALVVALQVLRMLEDDGAGQEVVDVGMAVEHWPIDVGCVG